METIQGRVWSVSFNSGDFYIFSVETSGKKVTCKGSLFGVQSVTSGLALELTGRWVSHPKWGRQFDMVSWSPWTPTEADVEIFLRSCLGVPAMRAGDIVDAFGLDTFKVMNESPHLLDSIPGMDEEAKSRLLSAWGYARASVELVSFLCDHDITSTQIRSILSKFGVEATRLVQANPYRLVEVSGFPFVKADDIAREVGVSSDDPRRYEGAVLWVLYEVTSSGHLCLRRGSITSTLRELTRESPIDSFDSLELSNEIAKAVERLRADGRVVVDPNVGVYLPQHYYNERESARLLAQLMGKSDFDIDPEEFVSNYQLIHQISLSDLQKQAITKLLTHKVLVLTGLPGTGKTTVVRAIVNLFERMSLTFALMAPTGIAAKRLASVTGHEASTIHRAFRYDGVRWGFGREERYPIGAVVVDECSMVDQELLFRILDALEPSTVLVLVGDDAQLPSVGPGNVLRELVRCPEVPTVRLTEIFRQAQESAIIRNSHRVNRGDDVEVGDEGSDFRFVPISDEGKAASLITHMAARLKARDENFQVLSPKYDGVLGVNNLNNLLRETLNPPDSGKREVTIDGCKYRDGDRLMVIRNDYKLGIYNGDMGKLIGIERDHFEVKIHGNVDMKIDIPRSDVPSKLKLAYAITVHKCVDPETLVETSMGLVPARTLGYSDARLVATPSGRAEFFNPVSNDVGPMLEIETSDGYRVRVTPDHGVDVWDPVLGYVRKEASAIELGMFTRLRLGSEFPQSIPGPLPPPPDTCNVRAEIYPVPTLLSPSVAEFLGMFVADGTLYHRGFRLAKRHETYADRFSDLCRELFEVEPKRFFTLGAHHVEVSSTYLATWLNGIDGLQPNAKEVPSSVMTSGLSTQAAFLRGLFEDGSVHLRPDGVLDHIEFVTQFDSLVRKAKVMLLRQGIISGFLRRKDSNYSVYVYGQNAKKFESLIGFISPFKSNLLMADAGNETRYLVPVLRAEISEVCEANGSRATLTNTEKNVFNRGTMSRHTLRGFLDRVTTRTPAWHLLDQRLNFHHSRVSSVSAYQGPSVCVEVPEGSQFIQDGFSGWNCQGSEFNTVILPMVRTHGRMLQRNLFYTAITRARNKVWVLGDRGAVSRAIANDQVVQRGTALSRSVSEALALRAAGVEVGDQEVTHGTDRDRESLRRDQQATD